MTEFQSLGCRQQKNLIDAQAVPKKKAIENSLVAFYGAPWDLYWFLVNVE